MSTGEKLTVVHLLCIQIPPSDLDLLAPVWECNLQAVITEKNMRFIITKDGTTYKLKSETRV